MRRRCLRCLVDTAVIYDCAKVFVNRVSRRFGSGAYKHSRQIAWTKDDRMKPQEAAKALITASPIAIDRINGFSHEVLRTRGGRVGSGMGTLLESLWGFYINQILAEPGSMADCEIGWLPDDQYNDFACLERNAPWNPARRSGELLRVEAKSMNTDADESKGHFDELTHNLDDWDLLLVLAWSWKDADGTRVYPRITDQFMGSARSVAELRDHLHIARKGTFVDRTNCPDGCAPTECTHHGEPLNRAGTRERKSGPESCKSKSVSYAANFGGLVRMLKTQTPAARQIFHEACDANDVARAYATFVQKNFVVKAVPPEEQRDFEPVK